MTDGQFDLRPILLLLVILAVLLATAQVAIAKPRVDRVDEGLTVVSSTVLGENTFTMTAWNVTLEPIDVDLLPPGTVAQVSVDTGVFDGEWTIEGLEAGTVGTMIGVIES